MSLRIPDIADEPLSPRQRAVHDQIASGPRGEVVGPLRIWLHSPELADKAQALGQFARYDSSLSPILSELAILVTARLWSSGFEWAQHVPWAQKAGLAESIIAALGRARRPEFVVPEQAAVFAYTVELQRDRQVSDETHHMAASALGRRGLVDLVGICGYYGLISMTINAFRVPDGSGPRLPAVSIPASEMFLDPSNS